LARTNSKLRLKKGCHWRLDFSSGAISLSYTFSMANDGERKKKQLSNVADVSRNRRQASVFLNEVARHNCEHIADKLLKDSNRLVEESRKLRAKARELRNRGSE
jgi:hypothetical protein